MELERLSSTGFRNLTPEALTLGPRLNLVLGANGQGKTNLLEAVAVLGCLRSFRTVNVRALARHGERGFALAGKVRRGTGTVQLEQRVTVGPPVRRTLLLDGRPADAATYLRVLPLFTLSAADRELVTGAPAGRRSLLDRFAFLREPTALAELRAYRRILEQRNAALARGAEHLEIESWEGRLAATAAKVVARRANAVAVLAGAFLPLYERLRGVGFPQVELEYRCEAWLELAGTPQDLEFQYQRRYHRERERDRRAGFTAAGPHRHDLILAADGRPAREVLSAGQVKVVAAALALAALEQVEIETGETLPVIADDVDAELDSTVLTYLVRELGTDRQLLLSSPRDESLRSLLSGGRRLWMARGACLHAVASGENA